MTTKQYLFISLIALSIGVLFFGIHQEWIIINRPKRSISLTNLSPANISKKNVVLFYWRHDRWQHEDTEILWSDDVSYTIQQLISRWLVLIDEEQLIPNKIELQAVLINTTGEIYISFDRYPFDEEVSTFQKIMFIEGLLKTLRENNINIQGINFLVHHQPLQDSHLDFSHSWPLQGFLS